MPQYHANSATFELPDRLKDKTMHMFTLSDDGPSDFSMVISHADTQPGEQLQDFGTRLMNELGRALPRFQLRTMNERLLDGTPAIELAYSWRNDGHFMHQRQVIGLVEGAAEGTVQAILIAATCQKPFTEEWHATFDQMLDSVRLRRPLAGPPAPVVQTAAVVLPSGLPAVFAFSERRRMLQVYANSGEACRKADAREVDQQAWSFFGADGEALAATFEIANAGTLWGEPGAFTLAPQPPGAARLEDQLHRVAVLNTSDAAPQFASVADIRRHLARVTGAAAD
jgi:hypothetical protein